MRKAHWEHLRPTTLKFSDRIKINGPGAGLGPISDAAVLRRIHYLKHTGGLTVQQAAEIASSQPYGCNELLGDKPPITGTTTQWAQASAFAHFTLFARGGEKIYKIGREFGEVLLKADLDIKAELFPDIPSVICVEFPEHIRFHDKQQEDYFHCAYIAIQKQSEQFKPVDRYGHTVFIVVDFVLPCYTENGNLKDEANNTKLCFRSGDEMLSASMERAQSNSTHPINCNEIFEYLLKFLIYLGSGDPDLREYRAPRPTTKNQKKLKRWLKEHENQSAVDMTLVGFTWKKPRIYQVGETTVTGHPRWQPWGPGKTQVKLIWIEPHIRRYGIGEHEKQEN